MTQTKQSKIRKISTYKNNTGTFWCCMYCWVVVTRTKWQSRGENVPRIIVIHHQNWHQPLCNMCPSARPTPDSSTQEQMLLDIRTFQIQTISSVCQKCASGYCCAHPSEIILLENFPRVRCLIKFKLLLFRVSGSEMRDKLSSRTLTNFAPSTNEYCR